MRIAVALAITLAAGATSPVPAASSEPAETVHHYHHRHHHHYNYHHQNPAAAHPVEAPAPEAAAPQGPRPYAPDQGDTDGLSRDPEDCDKGCIGGNPN